MKTTVHDALEFDVLGTDLGFTEGPVITDDAAVLVVDIDGGRVLRLADGTVTVVATPLQSSRSDPLESSGAVPSTS